MSDTERLASDAQALLARLARPIEPMKVQYPKADVPYWGSIPNGGIWNEERTDCAQMIVRLLKDNEALRFRIR